MKDKITTFTVKGTEWFSRLAVLNLFWFLFSLPIVTFIPATYAMFSVLNKWLEGDMTKSTFQLFKSSFSANFKHSYKLSIWFIIIGCIFLVNFLFFNNVSFNSDWFYILKYANYLLFILYILVFFFTFSLDQLVHLKTIRVITVSFILVISKPVEIVFILLISILLFLLFSIFPGLLFFFSISVLGLLFLKVTKKGYDKLLTKTIKVEK